MIFSSPIFLFFFLPIVLTTYFLVPKRLRNFFLLLASLVFYFWAETRLILVLLVFIAFNYLFGRLIDVFGNSKESRPRGAKFFLGLAVFFNLGFLVYYKYSNFLISIANDIMPSIGLVLVISTSSPHLPLGISFFTFRALSYLIDGYNRKVVGSKNLMTLSLFLSFFPTAIAGPLVRYGEMAPGFGRQTVTIEQFSIGLKRFIIGLGKKCLIANTLGPVVDQIFALSPGRIPFETAWLGILCYTLQI
jgi:alginate O-acetyltransferase complex protein AlgI